RQRADIIDTRISRYFAHLLDADFDFAAGDNGADKDAGRRLLEFRLDLVGNGEPLRQIHDVDTARAGRIADRFGRQQRVLERRGSGDVGFGRAGLDADADAGFGEVDAAATLQRAGGHEGVNVRTRHDQKIERL